MTLDEARSQMRALDEEYHALLEQMGGGDDSLGIELEVQDEPESQEKPQSIRCREIRIEKQRLGELFAGFPHLRPHLYCWMVDVVGTTSNLCNAESLEKGLDLLQGGERESFAALAGGALAQNVHRFITEELHLEITDSGGGCGSWHLGTFCTYAIMECLTTALHRQFAKAIAAGLIEVQVKFWGWRFRE